MLAELEEILGRMDSTQFQQELEQLGLFGRFTGAAENKANRIGNAEGIVNQGLSTLAGDIFGGLDSLGGSSSGAGTPGASAPGAGSPF